MAPSVLLAPRVEQVRRRNQAGDTFSPQETSGGGVALEGFFKFRSELACWDWSSLLVEQKYFIDHELKEKDRDFNADPLFCDFPVRDLGHLPKLDPEVLGSRDSRIRKATR